MPEPDKQRAYFRRMFSVATRAELWQHFLPELSMAKDVMVRLRCRAADQARWQEHAAAQGLGFSEWARDALDLVEFAQREGLFEELVRNERGKRLLYRVATGIDSRAKRKRPGRQSK